jgi:hypothetical protein
MGGLFYLLSSGRLGMMALPIIAFSVWMLVDCANNRREFYWYWIILGFWGIGALMYFFTFKWNDISRGSIAFSWWRNRREADEVRARVRHLDNAACYEDLGDSHWRLKQCAEAEAAYRKALEREPASLDIRAKLAQLLISLNRPIEAWPFIEDVLRKQRDYDTDEILRQAAQCKAALGDSEQAEAYYLEFLDKHSYFEAQIEYGEFLLVKGNVERGREQLEEVVLDIKTSPRYVRRRKWRESWRARWLLYRSKNLRENHGTEESSGESAPAPGRE